MFAKCACAFARVVLECACKHLREYHNRWPRCRLALRSVKCVKTSQNHSGATAPCSFLTRMVSVKAVIRGRRSTLARRKQTFCARRSTWSTSHQRADLRGRRDTLYGHKSHFMTSEALWSATRRSADVRGRRSALEDRAPNLCQLHFEAWRADSGSTLQGRVQFHGFGDAFQDAAAQAER